MTRRRTVPLALLLLTTLVPDRASPQGSQDYAPFLTGAAHFVSGDLDRAAASFRQIRRGPRRAQAQTALMLVALERGDAVAAAAALKAAVQRGGSDPETYYYGAVLALAQGRSGEALGHLERAQAIGGDRPPFLVARAVALRALGRHQEAGAALAAAARQDPDLCDPRLFPDTGRGLLQVVARALRRYPHQVQLQVTLAQLYLKARLFREAEALARQVLRQRRGEVDALLVLGRARLAAGDAEGALKHLDRAVALGPGIAGVRAARAEVELRLGRHRAARADLQRAVDLDPRDALSQTRLAARAWDEGQVDQAEELWGYALRRDPRLAAAHYGLAQAHDRQRRLAAAEEAYRTAATLEPANPRYHEALALFYERHGQRPKAAPARARARRAAKLARTLARRQQRAMRFVTAVERAAARARANDPKGARAALRGVGGPRAPRAYLAAYLAGRRGATGNAQAARALAGLPGPRRFATGGATLLRVSGTVTKGQPVRLTAFLPGVSPELLR